MQTMQSNLTPLILAPSRALTTAAEIQSQASSTAGADPAVLSKLAAQVSDAIAAFCDIAQDVNGIRTFARETLQEEVTFLRDSKAFWLARSPATVAQITINDDVADLADFIIDPVSGMVRSRSGATGFVFRCGDVVVVDYDAGYMTPIQRAAADASNVPPTPTTPQEAIDLLDYFVNGYPGPFDGPDLPNDLEYCCILGVQQAYSFAARESFDVESTTETVDDMGSYTDRFMSLSRADSLPAQVKAILSAGYKRLR